VLQPAWSSRRWSGRGRVTGIEPRRGGASLRRRTAAPRDPLAVHDHRQQRHRVVVPAAGGGLVDGHPLSVIEVQDLIAQGELPDQRVPERLAVAAPPPDVVPRPQPGEFGARGEQLADQRAQVLVVRILGLQRVQVGGGRGRGDVPVGQEPGPGRARGGDGARRPGRPAGTGAPAPPRSAAGPGRGRPGSGRSGWSPCPARAGCSNPCSARRPRRAPRAAGPGSAAGRSRRAARRRPDAACPGGRAGTPRADCSQADPGRAGSGRADPGTSSLTPSAEPYAMAAGRGWPRRYQARGTPGQRGLPVARRRRHARNVIPLRTPAPPAATSRSRLRGPSPERAGFGPRFVVACSFGSVLNPVNSSIIAVALASIGRASGRWPSWS